MGWFGLILLVWGGSVAEAGGASRSGAEVPFSPQVSRGHAVSPGCRKVLEEFSRTTGRVMSRLVGFWEPGDHGLTSVRQNQMLNLQRRAVSEVTGSYSTWVEREYVRGVSAMATGWGNCGEHTSAFWSETWESFLETERAGCPGMEVFAVDVSVGGVARDHVWIEVWVPLDQWVEARGRDLYYRSYGADEPMVVKGSRGGVEGYYFVFDWEKDGTGPYRVVRKIVHEKESWVPRFDQMTVHRRRFDPEVLATQGRIRDLDAAAESVARQVPIKR